MSFRTRKRLSSISDQATALYVRVLSSAAPAVLSKLCSKHGQLDKLREPQLRRRIRQEQRTYSRSRWSRILIRGSAAARLLGLRVRISVSGYYTLVCVVCCQRSLRRVDHSPRGILRSLVCPMSAIAKPRKGKP